MTDQSTKQAALDELSWEPSVNAAHIPQFRIGHRERASAPKLVLLNMSHPS